MTDETYYCACHDDEPPMEDGRCATCLLPAPSRESESDPCACRRAVPGMWTSGYDEKVRSFVRHGAEKCEEFVARSSGSGTTGGALSAEQIVALRPFLRTIGYDGMGRWAFIDSAGIRLREPPTLPLGAVVALMSAFRPHMLFSDVYSDDPPRSLAPAAPDDRHDPAKLRAALDAIHRVMHEAEESDDASLAEVVARHIRERDERIAELPAPTEPDPRDRVVEAARRLVGGWGVGSDFKFTDDEKRLRSALSALPALGAETTTKEDQ
jgi:hypothetical protein